MKPVLHTFKGAIACMQWLRDNAFKPTEGFFEKDKERAVCFDTDKGTHVIVGDDKLHEAMVCRKVTPGQFHNTSWSHKYVCRACGQSRRFNTNFIGPRNVICVGADRMFKTRAA